MASGGSISLGVSIDKRELDRLIADIDRARGTVEKQVRERIKEVAGEMKDVVADHTPVYEGGGMGNVPGTLKDSWEVERAGTMAYEIRTHATSKAGTAWAISYEDVVEIITRGHGPYEIWPRGGGFTGKGYNWYTRKDTWIAGIYAGGQGRYSGRKWLHWQEGGQWVSQPMVLHHPIEKNDFLDNAMTEAEPMMEQAAYDVLFDLEMAIIRGSTTPVIGGLGGLI